MTTKSPFAALPLLFLACQSPGTPTPPEHEAVPPAEVAVAQEPALIVTLRFQCQPGMGDTFLAAAKEMLKEVRKEPHFIGITIQRDQADADRIQFHERWADRDYYLGLHDATPHLGAFKEAAMPLLAGPPEIVLWEPSGEVVKP